MTGAVGFISLLKSYLYDVENCHFILGDGCIKNFTCL